MSPFAFVDRDPSPTEYELLRLCLSTFQDGSGWERDENGKTLPGWRQIERVVAEVFGGECCENKGVFDVILTSKSDKRVVGLSMKSKELSRKDAFESLSKDGRLYLEIANSPAEFWRDLKNKGITENDYKRGRRAQDTGSSICQTIHRWHVEFKSRFERENAGSQFDLDSSRYLVLSNHLNSSVRSYQWHIVPLQFPNNIVWKFGECKDKEKGFRCLRGFDPARPEEVIIDCYLLSGGQIKYYPRAKELKCSATFVLKELPGSASIVARTKQLWPNVETLTSSKK